jgi:hypothetical protein
VKQSPKAYPSPFLAEIDTKLLAQKKKVAPKMCALTVVFLKKTGQSKQSPHRRKFAQSGHPAHRPRFPIKLVPLIFLVRQPIVNRENIFESVLGAKPLWNEGPGILPNNIYQPDPCVLESL